ncbi:MAG: ectoine hydroxylase-related dioxygenase (phytanoyl-CoA dioxygenase family) [Candidatus Azotimanducaceae bacterium]
MSDKERSLVTDELIQGDGYAKLKSLMSAGDAARIRRRVLDEMTLQQEQNAAVQVDNGVIGVNHLLTLGPEFEALVVNPRLLAIVHDLLGADATLGDMAAKVLMPGCDPGGLHIDYPYWAMDRGLPVKPAMMLQVILMMEPFTQENGGTWIAPGSQKWTDPLNMGKFRANAIQALGHAGDAIVSHGMLWHQTAENHSTQPRVAILINYTQIAVRPMREVGPFDDEFKAQASMALGTLLGFDISAAMIKRALSNRVK